MTPPTVAIFGEAMLELSGLTAGQPLGSPARLGQGGDTLNTAWYLAALGCGCDYLTALGEDPYSEAMIAAWREAGIGTAHVLRHPDRMPGLYAIQTDAHGERSFHYWRDRSAARAFFDLPGAQAALAHAAGADWLFLSGISLSILDEAGRERLVDLAARVRARGGRVAFDPNYRPRGWPDPAAARAASARIAPHLDLVLPSCGDEDALFGTAPAASHAARWHDAGARLVVVKDGEAGCWIAPPDGPGQSVPVEPAGRVVDTTGAGDSFNAAFLAALIAGDAPADAAGYGNALARRVVGHAGALMPAAEIADLRRGETPAARTGV